MPGAPALTAFDEFSQQAARLAPRLALAAAILLVAAFLIRGLRSAVLLGPPDTHASRHRRARRPDGGGGWVVVGTVVLSTLQLQALVLGISGVLALMGAAFVTSASATSNDLIAGFFLAADPDIDVGYRIEAAGVQGVVRDIDFRKTRIVDDDGRLHVIPNRLVENAEWIVLARRA